MKRHQVYAVAAILAHLAVGPSMAQDIDDYLDNETLKLSEGYDKRLRYTPSTVIILDREYIRNTGALTVAELLERVVGIHVSRKAYGSSANGYIRGIDSKLLILHNGVENAKLQPELLAMPVIDLERVEVVKGSHYPLYGASAVAGTVNLVTTRVKGNSTRVGVRAGTLDTTQFWISKSNRLTPDIGYSGYFSHTQSTTSEGIIQRDVQTFIDEAIGTNASFAPDEGSFGTVVSDARFTLEWGNYWTMNTFFVRREFGTGVGLGQSLDPEGQEVANYASTDFRYERSLASGDLDVRLTLNYLDVAYEDLFILPPGAAGGQFPDGVIQRRYEKQGEDIFAEGLYRWTVGKHTIDAGVGAGYGRIDNGKDIRNYDLVAGADTPVPLGGFAELSDTNPLFDEDVDNRTAHVMLRNRYAYSSNVSINFGGRLDYKSDLGTFLIPRMGIDWIAGQYTNVGLLYGESVEAPSEVARASQGLFFAQGDSELDPAKIQLLELSVDHQFSSSKLLLLNLYVFRLTDTIAIVRDQSAPNGTSYINSSADEDGVGLDLVFSQKINDSAALTAGFSLVDVQSQDQSIEVGPRFDPYIELNLSPSARTNANFALIGVANRSRREGDTRDQIDDYTILNASFVYTNLAGTGLDLSFSAQNILNADAREDISRLIPDDLPVYPQRLLVGLTYGNR